jgi:hypothetical protein
LVLTGRRARTTQGDRSPSPRSFDAVAGPYSGRSATVMITSDSSSKSSGDSPSRRRQALPSSACRRSCWSDAQRCPHHPRLVLRETNSAQVGRSTNHSTRETATVNPAASSSRFTFWGVFTSSCQESFSATSAAPAASSSSTHWLRARLSRSVPPGEQADRPAGPQHPPGLSQPSGGSRQMEQHEGHHHRVKGPICERRLGRVADQQREVPGTQGHHRLGSIQANDQCPRRHPVKVREQRSTPQPRSRTRRACSSGSSSSSHRARPTRTGAHRSR